MIKEEIYPIIPKADTPFSPRFFKITKLKTKIEIPVETSAKNSANPTFIIFNRFKKEYLILTNLILLVLKNI